MKAVIKWIEYYLPPKTISNEKLSENAIDWTAEKIRDKTGIVKRHVAEENICASDMAYMAAKQLLKKGICRSEEIDFLLFCTQSPDYFLPTSACILQHKLNLPKNCGALDFNLGCSGYVYGLGLAKGLIETRQAKNVLLLTADTYTKYLQDNDISTRSIFGDAGSATLISSYNCLDKKRHYIGQPVYGTDGSGAENLIVRTGGMRSQRNQFEKDNFLYMNGPEIFLFTLKNVPILVNSVLEKEKKQIKDVDLFVFHQANKYILDHLRDKANIPEEKYYISMENVGNTVSSSIPIALKNAHNEKKISKNSSIMLVGFGVGYSWAGTIVTPFFEQ